MAEENNNQLKKFQEETVNSVLNKVNLMQENGELKVPDNYHVGNNLKLAWLHLQDLKDKNEKPVLQVCDKASIANALLEMVIKGLSVSKKQGYFIPYGTKLEFQPSYTGNLMIAKRDADVLDVNSQVIYDGDEYVTEVGVDGVKKLKTHIQKLENINNEKIKGAYAVVVFKDGKTKLEEMTMAQIKNAWLMGNVKGNSKAHTMFTDQMCKKTVMNRAIKIEINSSDDSEIDENPAVVSRNNTIKEEANKQEVKVEDTEFEVVSQPDTAQGQEQKELAF
jgi:recombination protein RecT